jgi:hypothetical protein
MAWRHGAFPLLAIGLACACGSPGGVTISGTVVTALPSAAGLRVGVTSGGNLQTVVANGDGTFQVTGVQLPYTAMVADIQLNSLNVYEGLTTIHPTLTAPFHTVDGTARHGGLECVATAEPGLTFSEVEEVIVGLVTPLGDGTGFGVIAALNSPPWSFQTNFGWMGAASLPADVYVLSYTANATVLPPPGQTFPVVFDGFGLLRGVTLEDGQTLTDLDAGLAPIASDRAAGSVSLAPGAELVFGPAVNLWAHPEPGHAFLVAENELGFVAADFSMGAPVVASLPLKVHLLAAFDGGSGLIIYQGVTAGDSDIVVVAPTPPSIRAPGPQPTSTYEWTAVEGAGIYLLQAQAGQALWSVYTSALTTTLPDAAPLGIATLRQANVTVGSFATPSSVDQLVGDAGIAVLVAGDLVEAISATVPASVH